MVRWEGGRISSPELGEKRVLYGAMLAAWMDAGKGVLQPARLPGNCCFLPRPQPLHATLPFAGWGGFLLPRSSPRPPPPLRTCISSGLLNIAINSSVCWLGWLLDPTMTKPRSRSPN